MKSLILLTFLFLTITCKVHAQQDIDSFLGIPFSMPPGEVRAMKTKNAVEDTVFNYKYNQTNTLRFNNVSIGGRRCTAFTVMFVNDKAAQAEFVFAPEPESTIVKFYGDLVSDIGKTYEHRENSRDFNESYNKNEDLEVTGLRSGTKNYTSEWNDRFDNLIIATVVADTNAQLIVKLTYRNTTLYNGHQAQQTDKLSEF